MAAREKQEIPRWDELGLPGEMIFTLYVCGMQRIDVCLGVGHDWNRFNLFFGSSSSYNALY